MMLTLSYATAKTDLSPFLNPTMKLPAAAASHLGGRGTISTTRLFPTSSLHSHSLTSSSFTTKFSSSNPNDCADDDDDGGGGGGGGIGVSDGGIEKKSFAVATRELFLGIAARLIRRREKKLGEGETIGGVEEEERVLWEQREKDVEAEKRRRYLAPRPATMFRNRLCIDGGLTLFMPPTSAAQTVQVCAFPASQLGLQGIGISPDCNPENRPGPRQLFNMALEPAENDLLDKLFEFGYRDAAVWVEQNPLDEIVLENGSECENGRMA